MIDATECPQDIAYPTGLDLLSDAREKSEQLIDSVYDIQLTMFKTRTHTIEDRIVSIHQPHVRPIVRGKTSAPVGFGAKIQVVTIDGISF